MHICSSCKRSVPDSMLSPVYKNTTKSVCKKCVYIDRKLKLGLNPKQMFSFPSPEKLKQRYISKRSAAYKARAYVDENFTLEEYLTILNNTKCYYCGDYTAPSNRCVVTKQPLSKRGEFTKENHVMGCSFCANTKINKTEKEFFKFLGKEYND